jgi:hypothetical protein
VIPENAKHVTKTLINPKLTYVNTYNYKNNSQEEFVIPAITFEVDKDKTDPNYFPEKVTVPLLKDFYKYDGN